ncbi:MAG TPA: DNA cytosine methyltransferase [Anaerolineales bacterium]|nr:DNA cytosine methyltransferase [Anaerolineales bacterium]
MALSFHTQTGEAAHGIVFPWIIDTAHTQANGKYVYPSKNPMPTQTTRQTLGVVSAFLSKAYGGNAKPQNMGVGLHQPTGTITTQDHHALIEAKAFLERASLVQYLDSLKVEDLYYRMLQPKEIGKAMAFRENHIVLGNSKEQTKQYGNAVTPPVMKMLMQRCIASLG